MYVTQSWATHAHRKRENLRRISANHTKLTTKEFMCARIALCMTYFVLVCIDIGCQPQHDRPRVELKHERDTQCHAHWYKLNHRNFPPPKSLWEPQRQPCSAQAGARFGPIPRNRQWRSHGRIGRHSTIAVIACCPTRSLATMSWLCAMSF